MMRATHRQIVKVILHGYLKMAKLYALVNKDGVVENIMKCREEEFTKLLPFIQTPMSSSSWIKVTEETRNPSMGGNFDFSSQKFYDRKPFDSWIFDKDVVEWKPPVKKPDSGNFIWSEKEQNWVELIVNECPDCSI